MVSICRAYVDTLGSVQDGSSDEVFTPSKESWVNNAIIGCCDWLRAELDTSSLQKAQDLLNSAHEPHVPSTCLLPCHTPLSASDGVLAACRSVTLANFTPHV